MFHRVDPAKEHRFHLVLSSIKATNQWPLSVHWGSCHAGRISACSKQHDQISHQILHRRHGTRHPRIPRQQNKQNPFWILGKPWECIKNCCQSGWWASGPVPIVQENQICGAPGGTACLRPSAEASRRPLLLGHHRCPESTIPLVSWIIALQ